MCLDSPFSSTELPFVPSPGIIHRDQFGDLLNLRGLFGMAVEIGTHQAEFAAMLLSRWRGRRLVCVDPWQKDLPDYDEPYNEFDREPDFQVACGRLKLYGITPETATLPAPHDPNRVQILRMTSAMAAKLFEPETLDFVYIDANHEERFVMQDIELWWPLIHSGGMLAGHDLSGRWLEHVGRPVCSLALRIGQPVYVVPGRVTSWYLIKP